MTLNSQTVGTIESKNEGKVQGWIQSSTTPDPGRNNVKLDI